MAENITPVTLEVSGFQSREVMLVDYGFNQATDIEGQLTGIPRAKSLIIRVKALNDGNNELLQWMLDPTKPLNVKINFNNTIDGKVMKTIEGTNCYCVKYTETWEDAQPHFEEINIVCQELKNGGAAFVNPWK